MRRILRSAHAEHGILQSVKPIQKPVPNAPNNSLKVYARPTVKELIERDKKFRPQKHSPLDG